MTSGRIGFDRSVAGGRLMPALALAAMLISSMAGPAGAQMFTDQPPPVPPAAVPDPGGAISLAPPSGPGSGPNLPAPMLTQPSIVQPSLAAVPPVAASPVAPAPNQAVLSLTARYGKDLPVINNGLVWRLFTDRPDENGTFKLIREERGAAGDPEVRNRPRILPASGGRPAYRRPRRRHQDSAEPDFVRDLQGQPV